MRWNACTRASALVFVLLGAGICAGRSQTNGGLDKRAQVAKPSSMNSVTKNLNGSDVCTPIAKPEDAGSSYVIGSGDVLTLTVWKDAELSRTMPVRPDGKISMPMLGDVQASGLTASQLQSNICERLADYIRNPQVNVTVSDIKSQTFNVVGRVLKAGTFELIKPTTVLDAIAAAGGFQEFARQSKIYVLRRDAANKATVFPFNYKQVIKGRRAYENVQLQSGDTVVVP